jgi:hypothetical protein
MEALMSTEATHTTVSYEDMFVPIEVPGTASDVRPARSFAGYSIGQIVVGGLVLLGLMWAMWTTREVLALRQHKIVSVRLGELVNRFALLEARSGDDSERVVARTRGFMVALDKALKDRSTAGEVVLVGEAVVSSSTEDITAAVAADVAKVVPMPVALALPPRTAVAPVVSAPVTASPGFGGIGGTGVQGSPVAGGPSPYAHDVVDPSAQGPDNGQQ